MDIKQLEKEALPGAFSGEDMEVFIPEVEKLQPGEVYLEVGVDKGRSLSIAKRIAKAGIEIYGVDLRPDPQVPGTTFTQGDSVEISKKWNAQKKISLLFIDGDHTYQGCKRDIEAWHPYMKEGGVMLFHDCDESSPGVMWAVAEFVCTHTCDFNLFKYNAKNTSIARLKL